MSTYDMDFFTLLHQVSPTLTSTEKNLATYLLKHTDKATHMTIRELGEAAGVSPSTVVRFVRTLGFDRYSRMMISIARADAVVDMDAKKENVQNISDIATYAARLEETLTKTIRQSIGILMENDGVEQAAEQIVNADMVYLYGVGSSGVIAQELLQKLLILGRPCFYQSDSYISAASVQNIGARDVAVGISYSGRNQAVITAVENAKKQGAAIICITKLGSRLAKLADVCLCVPPVLQLGRKGENLSRYTQSIALDMLFYEVSNRIAKM